MLRFTRFFGAAAILVAVGCDSTTEPDPQVEGKTITVDASTNYAFIRLGSEAQAVTPSSPSTSTEWDLGLFATSVMTNGGAAGPGGVTVACLCRPEPTVAELQTRTAVSELARFEAITIADVPAATEFEDDALSPAITGWFSNAGTAAAADPNRSFLVREGTTAAVFTKLRVTQLEGPTSTSPGRVTIEYASQTTAGGAFGAARTSTVNVGSGRTYFDLTSGAITDAANWDIAFDGYAIRVNGGVSGNGTIRALTMTTPPFGAVTATLAASVPANVYTADSYSGTFGLKPWYRYNITGTDNQIWPTYDVYLVRRGSDVFKVQLVGYYDTGGRSRQITVRYAPLAR
jgi:hypothetical protein